MPLRNISTGVVRPIAAGLLLGLGASVAQDALAGAGWTVPSAPTLAVVLVAVVALGLVEAQARGVYFDNPGQPGAVDPLATVGSASERIGTHCRPTGEHYRDGVYRVVGSGEDVVTLLRVADGAGRRRHTGEIVRVGVDVLPIVFVPAVDPDEGFTPLWTLRNWLQGVYWSVRWVV